MDWIEEVEGRIVSSESCQLAMKCLKIFGVPTIVIASFNSFLVLFYIDAKTSGSSWHHLASLVYVTILCCVALVHCCNVVLY